MSNSLRLAVVAPQLECGRPRDYDKGRSGPSRALRLRALSLPGIDDIAGHPPD